MRILLVALLLAVFLFPLPGAGQEIKLDYDSLKAAAELGDSIAQSRIGSMYLAGEVVPQSYSKALKWLTRAALKEEARAQYNLGVMYESGYGVAEDDTAAVGLFKKSADKNFARAQYYLGYMYHKGRGGVNSDSVAIEWYKKAAKQEDAQAEFALGWMYENGRGVAKDDSLAVVWYTRAADRGYLRAQNSLGTMFMNGRGVRQDNTKAFEWYNKAAKREHATAQNNMGWMYENGFGVPQANTKAIEWYTKAADQGLAIASNNLRVMLHKQAIAIFAQADSAFVNSDISLESNLYFQAIHYLEQAIDMAEKKGIAKEELANLHYNYGYALGGLWNISVSQKLMDYEKLDKANEQFEKCLGYTANHTKAESAKWQVDNFRSYRSLQDCNVFKSRFILVVLGVLVLSIGGWFLWYSKPRYGQIKPMEFLAYLGTGIGLILLALFWTQITEVNVAGIGLKLSPESYQSTTLEIAQPAYDTMKE